MKHEMLISINYIRMAVSSDEITHKENLHLYSLLLVSVLACDKPLTTLICTPTGLPGLYIMTHQYLKQHVSTNATLF